ncbi:MAG: PD40 domain-containing protein [Kiritimatiellae bacterium]|nr:PD40 domain-containing protein [Kiritimatiellia bacterium]
MRTFRFFLHRLSVTLLAATVAAGAAVCFAADAPLIQVVKKGSGKNVVSVSGIRTNGRNGKLFVQALTRDLDLSGWLKTGDGGSVTVRGEVADTGAGISSQLMVQWPGKRFAWNRVSMGNAEIRNQAHRLSDEIVKQIAGETGNAQSKIVFVNRKGPNKGDVYICDANGMGVSQVTHDNIACVGPRWSPDASSIYYTSFLRGYPEVYRLSLNPLGRKPLASFKGLNTGAAIAPDGRRAAIVLSYQGNPELYVLDLASGYLQRMTKTPRGSEASPAWSPDGASIAYVTDITGKPQIYLLNVATRRSVRLTYTGTENVNPDWNKKGQIVYASKRGGGFRIYTMTARGDGGSQSVDSPYDAEHPSWAPDGRHVVCNARGALYILDTQGDAPVRLFNIPGNWMSPDWSGR